MSDNQGAIRWTNVREIAWRADLLAKLALSRLKGTVLVAAPLPDNIGFDYLVTTREGFTFFVEVKGFSSSKEMVRDVESIDLLRRRVLATFLSHARAMKCPVVLFVFDVDTDHGRYLRVDNLPVEKTSGQFRTVRLPRQNTITQESIHRLLTELGAEGRA
jgi:hypothetical protein